MIMIYYQFLINKNINVNIVIVLFYETYQGILKFIDTRDKRKFINIVHHRSNIISPYMEKPLSLL